MPISVNCEACEYKFMVEGEHRGKRIRCPSCGDPILVGGVASKGTPRRKTRGDVRRQRLAREKSSNLSRTLMAAGIALTLIVMGVVGFVMMQSGAGESEVVNPTGDETVEPPQPLSDSPGGQDSSALMPATRDDSTQVRLVNVDGSSSGVRSVRHADGLEQTSETAAATDADAGGFVFTTWEQFNEHVQPSVVRVDVQSAGGSHQGSGFVVDAGGVIATNYHVIGGAEQITVTFHDRQKVQVKGYVHLDSHKDIALLKIDPAELDNMLQALPLMGDQPRTGAEVAAFGTPHGFDFTFTPGNVSGYRTAEEMTRSERPAREGNWVQHTAAISQGSSGGPLVSCSGDVVAMNTLFVSDAQNLNFGISSGDLRHALMTRTALIPVSPVSAPGAKEEKTLDGQTFGMSGYTIVDDARTVNGRRMLGQLKSLSVDGRVTGSDPRNVVEESVLSEARRQLRDSGVAVDNSDSLLRVFMTLERKGSGSVVHLSAMIFVDEGNRRLRRVWTQSEEVGGVAPRMLAQGQLPRILEGNIEDFFRRMRRAIMSSQRDIARVDERS